MSFKKLYSYYFVLFSYWKTDVNVKTKKSRQIIMVKPLLKYTIHSNIMLPDLQGLKRLLLLLIGVVVFVGGVLGQTVGDYQTRASGNWNANTTWQVYTAGSWVNCNSGDYPGVASGAGTVNILNNHTVTITSNVPNSIGALSINGGGSDSYIQFNPGVSLTVTGQTYLNSNSNNDEKSITVDAGIFSTGSISSNSDSNGDTRDAYIRISTGTVTVDGNIDLNSTSLRTYIRFTDNGTLNVGGTITGGGITSTVGGGANAPTSGTVNYNNAAQTVGTYTYNNLTLSGSGLKTTTGVTVNGILSMEGTATASVVPNYGTGATLQYAGSALQTTGVEFPTSPSAIPNLTINNANGVNLNSSKTVSGSLDLKQGSLSIGANTLTLSGTTTRNAPGTGTITGNASGNISIGGTGAFGTLFFTGGSNTINNLTINRTASGTITLGTDLSVAGTLTSTAGTINTAYNININNTDACGAGVVNATAGTITYSGTTQNIISGSYYILTKNNASATASLCSNIRINNILNVGAGIINLGTYNITISEGASITGAFSTSNMLQTSSTGMLIKEGNASTDFTMVYPVGTVSNYTPMTISSLTATVAGTGSVSVRAVAAVAPGPPAANSTDLQKYWSVTSNNLSAINANVNFVYNNPGEVGSGGNQTIYIPYLYSGAAWSMPAGSSAAGVNPFSVTGTSVLTGVWTAREKPNIVTYYSYQSGSWHNPTTWTTDPSGTLSVNSAVPDADDKVVVLNGRLIYTNSNGITIGSTQINDGGSLDLKATINHNLGDVRGKGILRLQSNTFPAGTFTEFESTAGGTVEYYNNADFNITHANYNNVIFNMSASNIVAYILSNITINGNLTITRGTLNINNNSATTRLDVTVTGNVTVATNGNIRTGTGSTGAVSATSAHRFIIKGNFTNNGTAYFTNLTAADYINYQNNRVEVVFNNPYADQNVVINGVTRFYRIEIDKGIDQTYVLNIDATAANLFYLWGVNNRMGVTPSPDAPNIRQDNALGLQAGTVRLGSNITLPSLAEENVSDDDLNYHVDEDACLWIDGATVTHTTSFNGGSSNSFVLYGKLRISNPVSSFNINTLHGIVMRANAAIHIENGSLSVPCIRTSTVSGAHRGSFNMSGGTLTITGNLSGSDSHASFSFTYPQMSFRMSGGSMVINQAGDGGNGLEKSLVIGSLAENNEVTGGTIRIIAANRNANFTSTAPFWNLQVDAANTTYTSQIVDFNGSSSASSVLAQPLIVKNDFTLQNFAVFNSGNQNVSIGHDFTMSASSEYNCGTNTTTFNGTGGQRFTNAGSIQTGTGLNNLAFSNSSNTDIISANIVVRGNLTIDNNCYVNDVGRTISVTGNITNLGIHTSQAGGGIELNATTDQTIGGNGNGSFGTLVISKSSGTCSFLANQSISGNLRLATGILDIGIHKLTLAATSNIYDALSPATTAIFSATKMIRTAGNFSDGGINKSYNATGSFVYPVGTATDYTPATITFNTAPVTWGSVTIKPVTRDVPFVTSTTTSLNYYWDVSSNGITGIAANGVSHSYKFVDADVREAVAGDINSYVPGAYRPNSWSFIPDPAEVTPAPGNLIRFNNINYIDGSFTAGRTDAFQSTVVYYSRQTGDWDQTSTWSTDSVGGPIAGTLPQSNTPVVIGKAAMSHTITMPVGFNNVTIGSLQINENSILDIASTTGHNFGAVPYGQVIGTGTLRISSVASSVVFPDGDFGKFLNTGGGTVEYYTNGTNFTLPDSNFYYNNLILNPANGQTITMPNTDLRIFRTLTKTGAGTCNLNSVAVRALQIDTNLLVTTGTLMFMNNTFAQTINVNGNIEVSNGAVFDVNNITNATNIINLSGNLVNNGTFRMYNGNSARVCNVNFIGNVDKQISGSGATTQFNILTVNKGESRNTILDVTASNLALNTTLATALILNNGTFRLSSPTVSLTLANSGSFRVPNTGCLSANGGTINIGGAAATNATDLYLDGRLEVYAGTVNIGTLGNNLNNDIEYSSAGSPELVVSGTGILFVNGQIRRPLTITTGSLRYTQGGSSVVTVDGRNFANTRAMLEILNSGSSFTMSGGTLNISRNFNNTLYPELYLSPETYSVSGGTVRIGSSNAGNNTQFNILSSAPLYNFTVDATTTNKNVNLKIYPLTVLNNFIIEGNSVFKANGLDVNIAGSLTNNNTDNSTGINNGGYQSGSLSQNTTFNGSVAQSISGVTNNVTNFANLINASTGSVSLNTNTALRVNNNLTLNSGSLSDGGNNITVVGDIVNRATHSSLSSSGGIVMAGAIRQSISGSGHGTFGNLELNNILNVDLKDNMSIDGVLRFTAGSLYIDDYRLTLGVNSSIAGTTDDTKMIIVNGVISDAGVRKVFPLNNSFFIYPIGVAGKYTPVTYRFLSNTNNNAYIDVRPVNLANPANNNAVGDELNYYWYVTSSGFAGAYSLNHTYKYLNADVSGTESEYLAGRYVSGAWAPVGGISGAVDATADSIHLASVNYIDGEYTAGATGNFYVKPTLYSMVASGNWFDGTKWSTTGHTGPTCNCVPDGNPVIIQAGHSVTLNNNSASAYSVELNGLLNIGQTVFHSLGHVTGGGKMDLTSTAEGVYVFPGGEFFGFMANSTSTLEFSGNNAASLPLKPGNYYKPYQNVILSGTGSKQISAENLKILGDLTINDGTTLDNSLFNKDISISGDWNDLNSGVSGGFISGTGSVSFDGSDNQLINISNPTTEEKFYNLQINNTGSTGVTISGGGDIGVAGILYLTDGNLITTTNNILNISSTGNNTIVGGGNSSFVDGPMQKNMIAGSSFNFPIGDGLVYGNAVISNVSVSGYYLFEYINHNPGNDTYNPSTKTAPIDVVSNVEYWHLLGPGSAAGDVTLRWNSASGIIPSNVAGRTKLRVVEWNSSWENRGATINDGGTSSGTIRTNISPIPTLAGDHYFTIGLESLPTATITSGNASICDDGSSTNISIALTGTAPWTIKYRINGANETTSPPIGSSPYLLAISNAIPALSTGGPGSYIFNVSYVSDATGSSGIQNFVTTATITLNESPNPVIAGNATVAIGETVTYSTADVVGHTYVWTVSNGSIVGVNTNSAVSVQWAASAGSGWVRVKETVTVGACSDSTSNYAVTITDIPNPVVSGTTHACASPLTTYTYSTPSVGTHTYLWTLPLGGGTISGSSTNNTVNVIWNTVGPRSVSVAETGSSTVNNTLPVTVNDIPAIGNTVTDPTICDGQTAIIVVQGAAAGITYQLRLNTDDSNQGVAVSSGLGGDVNISISPLINTTYNVYVTNEFSCNAELTDLSIVTVNKTPVTGPMYRQPNQ